jgi:hypothetical protein
MYGTHQKGKLGKSTGKGQAGAKSAGPAAGDSAGSAGASTGAAGSWGGKHSRKAREVRLSSVTDGKTKICMVLLFTSAWIRSGICGCRWV